MAADLRARVIAVLEAASYPNREHHLPTYDSGGTVSVIGGSRTGANVSCEWWDATAAELEDLRAGIAEALEAAGFTVIAKPHGLYVPPEEPGA